MATVSTPAPDSIPCPYCPAAHPSAYTHCPRTGKALWSGGALVGRVINERYEIKAVIGEGGMGAVYLAEHLLVGRRVAIKRLRPELAGDVRSVRRFQREARAAAATGHHHIVDVLDLGYSEDGAPFLVMEYLRGRTLSNVLRSERSIPTGRSCRIVGQVLTALTAVHAQGILHRDLKPDNVFLTRRGSVSEYVKLLDFGISKIKSEEGEGFDLTRTGVMMGTPYYMSPEQARGMKGFDHRVDLYAVGIMLYECLTGRIPFEGDNYHQLLQSILRREVIPASTLVADVPEAVDAVIAKAIARDPADRYQSAAAFLDALIPFGATPADADAALPPDPDDLASPPPESAVAHTTMDAGTFGASSAPARRSESLRTWGVSTGGGGRRDTRGAGGAAAFAAQTAADQIVGRYFFAASPDWDSGRVPSAIVRPARPIRLAQSKDDPVSSAPRVKLSGITPAPPTPPPDAESSSPPRRSSSRPPGATDQVARPYPVRWGVATPHEDVVSAAAVLDGHPTGLEARSRRVRTTLLTIALEQVESLPLQDGARTLREFLSENDRERLASTQRAAWIDAQLYDAVLQAAERAAGVGDGTLAMSLAEAVARRELPQTHKLTLDTTRLETALERAPAVLRAYHGDLDARSEPHPLGGHRLELVGEGAGPFLRASAAAGFVRGYLALVGATEPRVSVVACRGRGDARTLLAVRWR